MSTFYYEQVAERGWKAGTCVVCGKNAERSKTFTNTVNPFNRNDDGTVRTPLEVRACVFAMRREWEAEPVKHARCES